MRVCGNFVCEHIREPKQSQNDLYKKPNMSTQQSNKQRVALGELEIYAVDGEGEIHLWTHPLHTKMVSSNSVLAFVWCA